MSVSQLLVIFILKKITGCGNLISQLKKNFARLLLMFVSTFLPSNINTIT